MHAIYIREVGSRRSGEPLAIDIEDAALAERLVASIAGSYKTNGRDRIAKARWFRDESGRHRIWSEPRRSEAAPTTGATTRIARRNGSH